MKIVNTSAYPTAMIRRMLSWICREIEMPAGYLKRVCVTKTNWWYRGRAWYSRILLRVNAKQAGYPRDHTYAGRLPENGWPVIRINDPIEALVMIAAHEVYHVSEYHSGAFKYSGSDRTATEKRTEWMTKRVLLEFQKNRDQLLADWGYASKPKEVAPEPVLAAAASTVPTDKLIQKRYEKAQAMLAKWNRKANMAKGKTEKYAKQVRYYQKKLGITIDDD